MDKSQNIGRRFRTSQIVSQFPAEKVRQLLMEALDENDQISLLWAAYLFGFDRRRVLGAWGLGDTVELEFATAEDRDAALEAFGEAAPPPETLNPEMKLIHRLKADVRL